VAQRLKRSSNLPADPATSAEVAGLRYVSDLSLPGIRRVGRASRIRYLHPDGRSVTDRTTLQRIASLVIPPAWTDVWICPRPDGHLQATGRDARGRKQYRYHSRWRDVRDEVKYERLLDFAARLPQIRERTDADLLRPGLPREKVLAAVVQLLEKTLVRVGNDEYARDNGSIGLTTMRDGHARIEGTTLTFTFRGKSGVRHAVGLHDRRLARIVKACRDLPGQELFQYVDDAGEQRTVDSSDVNAYLKDIAGEAFTAKDFRTWAGTVLAACELSKQPRCTSAADGKRRVATAIEAVARRLGNTRAVSRKCYIHPAVIDAYIRGEVARVKHARRRSARRALTPEESAVVLLIERAPAVL
jgi:DNA topoisomerase-1